MDKSKLVFLDTETTGNGPSDRLCQVAYVFGDESAEALFKPPVPIQIEAMSVSHITNKMVADKEAFSDSAMHQRLAEIFAEENIMVAHNAPFDAEMLKREGIEVKQMIDTHKIVHHLDKDGAMGRHNLQYLRYYFDLEVGEVVPHSAMGDVVVLEKLFERLFQEMLAELKEETAVIQEMLEISKLPILMKKFNFGKYTGMAVAEVAKTDASYLGWLLDQKLKERNQGGRDDENWIYTLEYYLRQAN